MFLNLVEAVHNAHLSLSTWFWFKLISKWPFYFCIFFLPFYYTEQKFWTPKPWALRSKTLTSYLRFLPCHSFLLQETSRYIFFKKILLLATMPGFARATLKTFSGKLRLYWIDQDVLILASQSIVLLSWRLVSREKYLLYKAYVCTIT